MGGVYFIVLKRSVLRGFLIGCLKRTAKPLHKSDAV